MEWVSLYNSLAMTKAAFSASRIEIYSCWPKSVTEYVSFSGQVQFSK